MARCLGEGSEHQGRWRSNRIYKISGCLVIVVAVMVAVPVYYLTRSNSATASYPCDVDLSVPLLHPVRHSNGSIVDRGDIYPAGYHFTENGTTRGCLCRLKPCIRKCCAQDEHMVKPPSKISRCGKNPEASPFDNFTYPVYQSQGVLANVSQDHFRILYGDVCRHDKFVLDPNDPNDQAELMVDGRIQIAGNYIDAAGYCLESLNGSEEIRVLVCFPDPGEDAETRASFVIYPIGMITSIPFMVVTFLVYAILPELRNMHGISLMCHSAVLLTAYLFLSVIQIGGNELEMFPCIVFAFIVQFSFLASFFWLNVMCFDIWLVFRKLTPNKPQQTKKFVLYSLYAWGVPLVIVAISVAMDTIPGIPESYIKPHFGEEKCWFLDKPGQLLYFYLPILYVVVLNIFMFVSTAFKLRDHAKSTRGTFSSSESRRTNENDKDRFQLYLKLFIVMGVNWVMELVSFFVGGPKSVWFVTDFGNTLQGVFIFVIFVCKRRILRLLNEKLCPQWEIIQNRSSSGSKVSASRTNSSTVSKTTSITHDSVVLKPLARGTQYETDE